MTPSHFTFTFTAEHAQTILNVLSEQPYKHAAPIIDEMRQQATKQAQPAPLAAVPPATEVTA